MIDHDRQPFPDDRALPAGYSDAILDNIYEPEPQDLTPLAADDYQRKLKAIEIFKQDHVDVLAAAVQNRPTAELKRDRAKTPQTRKKYEAQIAAADTAREELIVHNLRLAASNARRSLNYPNQQRRRSKKQQKDETTDPDDRGGQQHYPGAIFNNLSSLANWPAPLADRIQEASIGLIRSVEKYNPGKAKLSTYATFLIEKELAKGIFDYGETSGARLPVHIGDAMKNMYRAEGRLAQKHAEMPGDQAIADDLDMDVDKVRDLRDIRSTHRALSFTDAEAELALSQPESDEGLTLADVTAHPDDFIEKEVMAIVLEDALDRVFDTLSEREAGVVRMRFGIGTDAPMTLDEISKVYGVTRERIRQIESATMKQLRHSARSGWLRSYLYADYDEPPHRQPAADAGPAPAKRTKMPAVTAAQEVAEAERRARRRGEIEILQRAQKSERRREARTSAGKLIEKAMWTVNHPEHHTSAYYDTSHRQALPVAVADQLDARLGDDVQADYLEWFWNEQLGDVVSRQGRGRFNFAQVNRFFFRLVESRLAADGIIFLNVPDEFAPDMDYVAAGMSHGTVEVNGSVGDHCAEGISGSAEVYINGDAGDMAGANMSGEALLDVYGSVGSDAGFDMSGDAQLIIGKHTRPALARGATGGD